MSTTAAGHGRADPVIIRVPDGRALAIAEYGPSGGAPVFVFDGTPGSRLVIGLDQRCLVQLGVRVIALDRPGFGYSDPLPNRTPLDWAEDVRYVADALGIERFAIRTHSGGAVHGAAVAWAMPDRCSALAVVAGTAPMMDMDEWVSGMHEKNEVLFRLLHEDPTSSQHVSDITSYIADVDEEIAREFLANGLQSPDREWADPDELCRTWRDAYRQRSDAMAQELLLMTRPWGFEPSHVSVPVRLWWGDRDQNVPLRHGEYLAEALPSASLVVKRGEGHLSILRWTPEMLAWLRDAG